MSKFFQIVLCAVIISVFAEEVYGLTCLRCQSKDVNSRCRYGQRSKTTKKQACNGPNAKCLVVATVDEYGNSNFQRGCTLEDICADKNDTEIEYCFSCASKHCNYNVMELDEEVEAYLNEVREYEIYLSELLKNTTEQANSTVPSEAPISKTNGNSNTTEENTPLAPNQIIVGYSDEDGVPITATDEPYGNPSSENYEETSKSNETPKKHSRKFKSKDYVEFGTKLIK